MTTNPRQRRRQRAGAALLSCLFVVLIVSSLVANLIDTEMLQFAETRNTLEYEQALYQANAGVQHACAELTLDTSWRGTVSDGLLPPALSPSGYTATASDLGADVLIISTGYSGLGARTVEATVSF